MFYLQHFTQVKIHTKEKKHKITNHSPFHCPFFPLFFFFLEMVHENSSLLGFFSLEGNLLILSLSLFFFFLVFSDFFLFSLFAPSGCTPMEMIQMSLSCECLNCLETVIFLFFFSYIVNIICLKKTERIVTSTHQLTTTTTTTTTTIFISDRSLFEKSNPLSKELLVVKPVIPLVFFVFRI